MPRLHSGAAVDRPETTNLTFPPIPEVVWQQPQETHLTNIHEVSTTDTHKNTNMPEFKQRNDIELQTSPLEETSSQVSGSRMEPFLGSQTGSRPVQSLNDSKKRQCEIQGHEKNMTANDNGDDNISLPKKQLHKLKSNL